MMIETAKLLPRLDASSYFGAGKQSVQSGGGRAWNGDAARRAPGRQERIRGCGPRTRTRVCSRYHSRESLYTISGARKCAGCGAPESPVPSGHGAFGFFHATE